MDSQSNAPERGLFTLEQAANSLGVSTSHVRRLVKKGKLAAATPNHPMFFRRRDVATLKAANGMPAEVSSSAYLTLLTIALPRGWNLLIAAAIKRAQIWRLLVADTAFDAGLIAGENRIDAIAHSYLIGDDNALAMKAICDPSARVIVRDSTIGDPGGVDVRKEFLDQVAMMLLKVEDNYGKKPPA